MSATASKAAQAAQVAGCRQISAAEDHTAASQRLVFDEIAEIADLIQSFSIGLLEAARRADRVRVHGYIADIVRCGNDARGAYGRVAALAKPGEAQR